MRQSNSSRTEHIKRKVKRASKNTPPPKAPGHELGKREMAARLWPVCKRLPAYLRLAWSIGRDPAVPRRYKKLLYTAVVYQVTPLHFVFSLVPVVGQVDTPLLLLFGIRKALASCPPEIVAAHFSEVGLAPSQLQDDLATVSEAAHWLVRRTARGAGRGVFLTRRAMRKLTPLHGRRKRSEPGGQ